MSGWWASADPRRAARRLSRALSPRLVAASGLLLTAGPYALRLPLLLRRGFNPDEFQHLHGAWCLSRGLVPYRDYFEHHTPALHAALAALSPFFDVAESVEGAFGFIFLSRRVMWLLTGAILVSTFGLARRWRGRRVAWAAVALLSSLVLFPSKSLEIRPDVPATALLVASWTALVVAVRRPAARAGVPALASGLCLGLAVLCTQKALFAVPGAALALLLAPRAPLRERARAMLPWALGLLAPIALVVAMYAALGGLRAFVECTLLVNLRWKGRLGAQGIVDELLRENPVHVALAVAGLLAAVDGWLRRARREAAVPVLALLSLLAGTVLIPAVYRQYFLLLLPLLAAFAAAALVDLSGWLARPAGAVAARLRLRDALLAAALVALAAAPFRIMARAFDRHNTGALEDLRFVLRNAAPWESVMDGFTGLGVFRPHVGYYYFVHDHLRLMLDEPGRAAILSGLRSGREVPKLVVWDRDLRALGPELSSFVSAHYAPVGREPLRARLFDNGQGWWRDEGPRPLVWPEQPPLSPGPHLFLGDGWRRIERQGALAFRRSRGGRAELLVPVRDAAPARAAVLRAAGSAGEVELRVNGRGLERVPVAPGWRSYVFALPAGVLRPGFNSFVVAPSGAVAGADGLAVESLALVPATVPQTMAPAAMRAAASRRGPPRAQSPDITAAAPTASAGQGSVAAATARGPSAIPCQSTTAAPARIAESRIPRAGCTPTRTNPARPSGTSTAAPAAIAPAAGGS